MFDFKLDEGMGVFDIYFISISGLYCIGCK